jgi:hypothetical protein
MDAGVDGRWMSYAELAEVRRIDKASALKLAIRRGWLRQKNNHGQMQVCVPLDWAQPPERLRDTATDRGMDGGVDLSTALAAYEAAQTAFTTALAAKDRQIVAMEATISAQAQVVSAAEVRAAALTQEVQAARQEAEALKQADAARRGQGRLARLRAAWRGE